MARPTVLGRCPVCSGELSVTRLQCEACDTALEGRFRLGRYAALSPEQGAFLDLFIKSRGIIKEVEAELGVSYRTVVSRLDDLLRALGHPVDEGPPRGRAGDARQERRRILEDVRAKRITADEAARRLAALGDGGDGTNERGTDHG